MGTITQMKSDLTIDFLVNVSKSGKGKVRLDDLKPSGRYMVKQLVKRNEMRMIKMFGIEVAMVMK